MYLLQQNNRQMKLETIENSSKQLKNLPKKFRNFSKAKGEIF
jgi:hypothetical protein